MSEHPTPRTTRDALVLDAIRSLDDLSVRVINLNNHLDTLDGRTRQTFEHQLKVLGIHIEQIISPALEKVNDTVLELNQERVKAVSAYNTHVEDIKLKARDEFVHIFTDMARELSETERAKREFMREGFSWRTLAATAFCAAVLAASMTYFGTYRLFVRSIEDKVLAGEAVMAAWDKLDAKAKKIITDSF